MLVILGPTASGKTQLAIQLAHHLNGEILSADSRQVYRGMDIGTGKDLSEYDEKQISYQLIDIVEAGTDYHVFRYQQDFQKALDDIVQRNKTPILCGGTGFYIESVLKKHQFTAIPIDEYLRHNLLEKTDDELLTLFQQNPSVYSPLADISTRKRLIRAIEINTYLKQHPTIQLPNFSTTQLPHYQIFGINLPVEIRRERITKRLHQRLKEGMIEEVKTLLSQGVSPEKLVFYGLEYKFATQYLQGQIPYEIMVERLNVAIHQFAKRQMTFFRKMERDGLHIHWLDGTKETDELVREVLLTLSTQNYAQTSI
jgi:tRNA dimethylallyltransferase